MTSYDLFQTEDFDILLNAFKQLQSALSYLKADISPNPEDPGYIRCHYFLNDDDFFKKVIETSGHAIGAPDQQTTISLFVLSYSYRLLALSICPLFISGVMPDASPINTAFMIPAGRVSKLSYLSPRLYEKSDSLERDLEAAINNIIVGHLEILIERIKTSFRIGSKLLWGNVASSSAAVFRTLEGILGKDIIGVGEKFFELSPDYVKNQGSFYLLECGGKHGWYWERKNCCLYYKLTSKTKCGDCSLHSKETRRENYKNQLLGK